MQEHSSEDEVEAEPIASDLEGDRNSICWPGMTLADIRSARRKTRNRARTDSRGLAAAY